MIQYPFLPTGTTMHSNRVDMFTANLKTAFPTENARGGKVEPLDLHSLRDCPEHTLSRPHTYTSGGNAQDHACTRLGSSVSRYVSAVA